jgi:NAD-dependent SIR2 family protein deacetylase
VHPAAGLIGEAKRRGAFTAEINLEATPASGSVDLTVHGPAEQILPRVSALLGDPAPR